MPGDPISNAAIQALISDEIETRVSEAVVELIQGKQFIDAEVLDPLLLGAPPPVCDPFIGVPAATQCAAYQGPMNALIPSGYAKLKDDGVIETETADDDVNELFSTVQAEENWQCDAGRCQFKVAASRLNVYPDAVELVFFDDKDLDSFAFALYTISYGLGGETGRSVRNQLCRREHDSVPSAPEDGLVETFSGYGWPQCESCELIHCTECALHGCLGCGGGDCVSCQ